MSKEIIIQNLNYNILKDFSISFDNNMFYTLSSPNRCGKTTLLKYINKEYNSTLIDNNIYFEQTTVLNEIKLALINNNLYNKDYLNQIIKKYDLEEIKSIRIDTLSLENKVYLKLIVSIINNNDIILIDNIDNFVSDSLMIKIIDLINQVKEDKIIIMTLTDLKYSEYSDYLYIINNEKIVLKGKPIDVLKHDNTINKLGIDLPFMVDLSTKLRDYDLIDTIITDMDGMVDLLWK